MPISLRSISCLFILSSFFPLHFNKSVPHYNTHTVIDPSISMSIISSSGKYHFISSLKQNFYQDRLLNLRWTYLELCVKWSVTRLNKLASSNSVLGKNYKLLLIWLNLVKFVAFILSNNGLVPLSLVTCFICQIKQH